LSTNVKPISEQSMNWISMIGRLSELGNGRDPLGLSPQVGTNDIIAERSNSHVTPRTTDCRGSTHIGNPEVVAIDGQPLDDDQQDSCAGASPCDIRRPELDQFKI
jgi:hypothetical protein